MSESRAHQNFDSVKAGQILHLLNKIITILHSVKDRTSAPGNLQVELDRLASDLAKVSSNQYDNQQFIMVVATWLLKDVIPLLNYYIRVDYSLIEKNQHVHTDYSLIKKNLLSLINSVEHGDAMHQPLEALRLTTEVLIHKTKIATEYDHVQPQRKTFVGNFTERSRETVARIGRRFRSRSDTTATTTTIIFNLAENNSEQLPRRTNRHHVTSTTSFTNPAESDTVRASDRLGTSFMNPAGNHIISPAATPVGSLTNSVGSHSVQPPRRTKRTTRITTTNPLNNDKGKDKEDASESPREKGRRFG